MIDGIPNRPLYFYQKDIIAQPSLTPAPFLGSHSWLLDVALKKDRTASLRSAAAGCCALRQSLNKLSRTGVPVVLTIHQPSSECLGGNDER